MGQARSHELMAPEGHRRNAPSYGSDFPVANTAMVLITSAIAKGRIEAIGPRRGQAGPGVLEIFYHGNSVN